MYDMYAMTRVLLVSDKRPLLYGVGAVFIYFKKVKIFVYTY